MHHSFRKLLKLSLVLSILLPSITWAKTSDDILEPKVEGKNSINLFDGSTLTGWKVPSDRWSIKDRAIVGIAGPEPITTPEWLYTKKHFSDFILTAELRLTGTKSPNSGIYFRVQPFQFTWRRTQQTYSAPSGYEFDVVSGKHCGSLGDWYARPSLRIFANKKLIEQSYKANEWNRMTIRAIGNRIEYWMNGTKIMDYTDNDPKRSKEGVIGIQLHDKTIMKIECRSMRILPLGITKN
ncbi:DUF1080 domain-containing protein [Rubritalea spongiae]|uniref:DUF1080 domain-containing protein n=1 Tax=Rubritalea spongiae TaxID=430797 RepID=A0ABW5E2U7_9BACT